MSRAVDRVYRLHLEARRLEAEYVAAMEALCGLPAPERPAARRKAEAVREAACVARYQAEKATPTLGPDESPGRVQLARMLEMDERKRGAA